MKPIENLPKLEIRIAKKEDAVQIAVLGKVTFTETFGHLFRDPQDLLDYYKATFSENKIEKSFSKSNNLYWIAFADRLPVGYAKLKLNSPSEFNTNQNSCQLQKLYVLKDFLSMKIGFQLQNQLLEKATLYGCKFIWLSVLNENTRAINFYIKNGFVEIGTHDFDIGKENFHFTAMFKPLV